MKYYHFCTEGLRKGIIFRDDEDYIVAMNYVAITARECDITILAFCLMSNHWHFVVRGNVKDVSKFNTMLKRRVSMWLHRKYEVSHYLKGQGVTIKEVESLEYLKRVIGYVLRNPIVAGINCTIESYRWGSGGCYFQAPAIRNGHCDAGIMVKENDLHVRETRQNTGETRRNTGETRRNAEETRRNAGDEGDRAIELSPYAVSIICKTRSEARTGVQVDHYGMIPPSQYVDASTVMNLFKTAKAFIYNVMSFKSLDMDIELETGLAQKITVEDNELVRIVEKLCVKEFHVKSAEFLPTKEKCKLAIMLRKQYGASVRQIARIIGLDPEVVEFLR